MATGQPKGQLLLTLLGRSLPTTQLLSREDCL